MQAGFDAVELHAAHGYLISQFMSPYLNKRIDRFGGGFENRMRFPLAIVASIQKKCGPDFPVLIRYSADEWVPGGRELAESVEVAKVFENAGVAALDLSQCIQESPGAGFDPMQYPEGWTLYASEAVKKAVKIPIIISHSLRNPEFCEQALAEGKTDMVGLSRQILADPYWPLKAKLREGAGDPPLHLLPDRLLAGIHDGQEGDRLRRQPGLRQRGLRAGRQDRQARAGGRGRRGPGGPGGGARGHRARAPGHDFRKERGAGRGHPGLLHGPGQGREDEVVRGLAALADRRSESGGASAARPRPSPTCGTSRSW